MYLYFHFLFVVAEMGESTQQMITFTKISVLVSLWSVQLQGRKATTTTMGPLQETLTVMLNLPLFQIQANSHTLLITKGKCDLTASSAHLSYTFKPIFYMQRFLK